MRLFRLAATAAAVLAGATTLWAQVPVNPFAQDKAAIAAGQVIYDTTCAACHGVNGAGGNGPALNTGHFAHGDGDDAVFQIIRAGIPETQMPNFAGLSADSVWRVVAYLKSLPMAGARRAGGDAGAGQQLYDRSGCAACHEINGRGRDLAADLSAEGMRGADAIRDGIGHKTPAVSTATATLANGKDVSGVVRGEDSFALDLEQRDGMWALLDKKNLRAVSAAQPLSGPAITAKLSSDNIDDLVAFLLTQKARNLAETAKAKPLALLPYERIAAPQARDWPAPRGSLDGGGFSALTGVTPANAGQLQARWAARLGDGAAASTPIVADGVLYVSGAAGAVYAFDARSGLPLWRFTRAPAMANAAALGANRGVAVLDGRVFVGTPDNKLIALDAHTGRELWEKQTASTLDGYAMTGAPLALHTRIIVGVNGAGPKARGWLDAYDPATGERFWRLNSITGAQAAGAMTASVGAYEPANVTLYWSIAAASDGGGLGDSLIAINANSGAVTWRHALKAGAGGGNIALTDISEGGKHRLGLLHVGHDGLLSLLDRANGKPVLEKPAVDGAASAVSFSFDHSGALLYAGLDDAVAAIDARTGHILWRTAFSSSVGGVLATRGGVVFVSTAEGQFIALDAKTGKVLWHYGAGMPITASPISYAVDAKQYIAVVAGNQLQAFALSN